MIAIKIHKQLISADSSFDLSVDFSVKKGVFTTIYGKSGAGKTTLLRIIAGLEKPDTGILKVNDVNWFDSNTKTNLKPQLRKIGMVFQDFALFPNFTILENLEFALAKNQSKKIISELIETMELSDLLNRKPNTLSGGQKQRVALARALVQQPDILLLDEPLSALDDEMRHHLQDFILKVHKNYNLTTFMVSHDISEVFKLSDEVLKIDHGKIIASGTPEALFLAHNISGKFKSLGTVLSIKKADVVYIVSVLSGSDVIRVIATENDVNNLNVGDKVMVVAKAFSPVLVKV